MAVKTKSGMKKSKAKKAKIIYWSLRMLVLTYYLQRWASKLLIFKVRKSSTHKFLGSFHCLKSANFLDEPVRKS